MQRVVERAQGGGNVELSIVERETLAVGQLDTDVRGSIRARHRDHGRVAVDRDDLTCDGRDCIRERARATADVEHTLAATQGEHRPDPIGECFRTRGLLRGAALSLGHG
jgi:hypothetical protein